jgi:hypothetical protein
MHYLFIGFMFTAGVALAILVGWAILMAIGLAVRAHENRRPVHAEPSAVQHPWPIGAFVLIIVVLWAAFGQKGFHGGPPVTLHPSDAPVELIVWAACGGAVLFGLWLMISPFRRKR